MAHLLLRCSKCEAVDGFDFDNGQLKCDCGELVNVEGKLLDFIQDAVITPRKPNVENLDV